MKNKLANRLTEIGESLVRKGAIVREVKYAGRIHQYGLGWHISPQEGEELIAIMFPGASWVRVEDGHQHFVTTLEADPQGNRQDDGAVNPPYTDDLFERDFLQLLA